MKKLQGLPTLAVALSALLAWVLYRYSLYPRDHALQWRLPFDTAIYMLAGQDVASGGRLYDAPYIGELPFTYPPFAGAVFSWISDLSQTWIISIFQVGTGLALWAVILLVLRNRRVRLTPLTVYVSLVFTLCLVALDPIQGTLFFGQINVFLMFLVALDLLPRKWRLPGVGIGLAAGLKLTPAYLGLVLVAQRRWWSVLGAVATFAATVGLGFWLVPDAREFWTYAIFHSARVGTPDNPGSLDAKSLLIRLFDVHGGAVYYATIGAIFALTVAALAAARRRQDAAAAMTFAGLSACLVSPFSWYHHFVWVAPLAALILVGSNRLLGRWLHGPLRGQLAGLLSLLITAAAMLPWVTPPVWRAGSWTSLNDWVDFQPWATLLYSGAGLIYMTAYAIYGLGRPKVSISAQV